MECLPGWNAILGLILGFSISIAIMAMIILEENEAGDEGQGSGMSKTGSLEQDN